ncbi:MAG: hypothetical protein GX801_07260 [Fibrobacter sp.]|nr:hypothetical protein [Fibrobacter sp.]
MKTLKIMLFVSLFVGVSFAQIQTVPGKGTIDWTNRTVEAVGIGAPNPNMPEVTARPMAIRAARDVALRNALELVKGLQLNSTTTVENLMVQNDAIRTTVEGKISTFQASEPRYMSDKTIEITVKIPMDSGLVDAISTPSQQITPVSTPAASSPPANKSHSGLIIDARKVGVIPALAPKIIDEDGKEVYGVSFVGRDWVLKWGTVGYAKTTKQAMTYKERIGSNPKTITAINSSGSIRCDLVISNKDAQQIRQLAKSSKLLSDGRVMVVVK